MSSGEQVRVEPWQLRGKAGEMGYEPPDALSMPAPPCALGFVIAAATTVQISGGTLKNFMESGNVEGARLSETLRAIADAYAQVDEHTRAALAGEGDGSIVPVRFRIFRRRSLQ